MLRAKIFSLGRQRIALFLRAKNRPVSKQRVAFPGRAKISALQGCDILTDKIRAGFEPHRGLGIDGKLKGVRCLSSRISWAKPPARNGSNPARSHQRENH